MTIKEVEQQTGLQRSNIRFYEKEGLVTPKRNSTNGYRVYSEQNVADIKKIVYLRILGISVEDIRKIMGKEEALYTVIKKQEKALDTQITGMEQARLLCRSMLEDKNISFEDLEVERYLPELEEQCRKGNPAFHLDCVSFLYLWGGIIVWGLLTAFCLFTAVLSYGWLPSQIPVQWSRGKAVSLAAKGFIFAYPAACVILRFLLRPFIGRWLYIHSLYSDTITNYITNYFCFVAFSVEIFTVLFVQGIVSSAALLIAADTVVLLGLLWAGWRKTAGERNF